MTDEQTLQALAEIEAKYGQLLDGANEQIELLKRLCHEKNEMLTEKEALLESYRQHDELQKARIAQLETQLDDFRATFDALMMRFS